LRIIEAKYPGIGMLDREEIVRALEHFNRYHSPEAVAELVSASSGGFSVRFCGPFVLSCCLDEYFEDLKYDLLRIAGEGVEVDVEEVRRLKGECFLVNYRLG